MILIRDVQVIDGTGRPPHKSDVLLKNDRISAIGNLSGHKADQVVEGDGGYLAPGFIDIQNRSDHYLSLFSDPSQSDFLAQGVTTIIGGHCGSSLAPLLYGSLESIRKWGDPNSLNVGWHTTKEFLSVIERLGLGVNFGTLAGHSTIRRALIGEDLRDLTVKEMEVFKRVLDDALAEGAFGLSTGLGYAHSARVPYGEIKELASVVAAKGGLYSTHLRDERGNVTASIEETIKLARDSKAKTLIGHFRPLLGFENEFAGAEKILREKSKKLPIYFTSYPFDTSLVPIYTLLPGWIKSGNLEAMLKNAEAPHARERILHEFPEFKAKDIVIVKAPGADYLTGKSIGEFSLNQELSLKEGLLKLMRMTKMRAVVFWKNINVDMAIQSLEAPYAIPASNAPNISSDRGIAHERLILTFPKFLEIAVGINLLSIEEAIRKMTSLPAKLLGFRDRGEIKQGNIADLVIIREKKITDVFINGICAFKDGAPRNIRAGRVLRLNET